MHQPSPTRVALRHLEADQTVLDGLPRRKALALVNAAIDRAPTKGVFRDEYWQGIRAVWKALEQQNIPFGITKSDYERDPSVSQEPVRKVWKFEVPFVNDRGQQDVIYGRVVAGGAGPVSEPLAAYDVVAYVT